MPRLYDEAGLARKRFARQALVKHSSDIYHAYIELASRALEVSLTSAWIIQHVWYLTHSSSCFDKHSASQLDV